MATRTLPVLSISPSSSQSSDRNPINSSSSLPWKLKPCSSSNSFFGSKLSIRPLNSIPLISNSKRRAPIATVLFSLPTIKPDATSSEKPPKWSARAIKSFAMAELEARKLKYPNTGTEALLMGVLVEATSQAAKYLRANGITLFKVRDEIINLLGKSDLYIFSPEHPPLTEPAQKALDWAVDQKLKSGEDGEITVTHMVLGIWSEKESAGHKIMAGLGFNDEKAKELTKFMNTDVGFTYKKGG